MTVGQLIQRLRKLNQDMPVVVRTKDNNFLEDFTDLKAADIVELSTKEVFKQPYWGVQLYDASEGPKERPTKVLSLTGGTVFQRGSDEKEG